MDGKIKDYLIYGVLGIVFIFSLYLIFSPEKEEQVIVNNDPTTKEELILDTPALSVKEGEEVAINAHVNNNANALINYISMNNDIATLTGNHTVKGVKSGKTYIMVTYKDSSGTDQIKHCSVDVLTNENYQVEKITIADGEVVLKIGETYKLEYQVTPSDTPYKAEYQSSDSSIASVDNAGNIKGLKEGIVAIRVSVKDTHEDKIVYVTSK